MPSDQNRSLADILARAAAGRWRTLTLHPQGEFAITLDTESVQVLASELPGLDCLEEVCLVNQYLTGEDARPLFAAFEQMGALHTLDLQRNRLGPRGAAELAAMLKCRGGLHQLRLYGNSIGPDGLAVLMEAGPALRSLEVLELGHNMLGSEGVRALVAAGEHLPSLRSLELSKNDIDRAGASALAEAPAHFPSLRSLSLNMNDLCDEGLWELAKVPRVWTALTHLDLSHNRVWSLGMRALASLLSRCPALSELSAAGNHFGRDDSRDEYASSELLSAAAHMRALRLLDLNGCSFQPNDAEAIAALVSSLDSLVELDLGDNHWGAEPGKLLIAAAGRCPKLERLRLAHAGIGNAGAEAIVTMAPRTRLRELRLQDNEIDDAGANALAEGAKRLEWLVSLDLSSNAIGDSGLDALLHALNREPWRSSVEHLDLGNNFFSSTPPELDQATDASAWRAYLEELAQRGHTPLHELKILLLGEGRVGKSHLRQRLFGGVPTYHEPGQLPTHDIETVQWTVSTVLNDLDVDIRARIWDFGGQPNLHASHRLFLSDRRGLFVIVCDATKTRIENRLDYWLKMIRHEASADGPIVIVVTKCDLRDNDGEAAQPRQLEALDAEDLRETAGLPRSTPLQVVDGVGWSGAATGRVTDAQRWREHHAALRQLSKTISDLVLDVPDLRARYPTTFIDVIRWIELNAFKGLDGSPLAWVRRATVEEACRQCGLNEALTETVLETAHNIGIVHCPSVRKKMRRGDPLSEAVFNPAWVRTPVYRLIRQADHASTQGMLSWAEIEGLLQEHDANPKGETLWDQLAFTSADRVRLIDLMVSCELVFDLHRVNREPMYFVPDHLRARRAVSPPVGDWVWVREFDWLSDAVFSRLVGRLHQQGASEPTSVWRDEIGVSLSGGGSVVVRACGPTASSSSVKVYVSVCGGSYEAAHRHCIAVDAELRSLLGERLIGPLAWELVSGSPENADVSTQSSPFLPVWRELTPRQRAILRCVAKHEDQEITFAGIAEKLEVATGRGGKPEKLFLSDKTVRAACAPMLTLELNLLTRDGRRGGLTLTAKGHSTLEAGRLAAD